MRSRRSPWPTPARHVGDARQRRGERFGTETAKAAVREFWEAAACGETLLLDRADLDGFERQARLRYRIEPYIAGFAGFDDVRGRAVLMGPGVRGAKPG